eukprot:1363558-Ditylum_brightwellii.AAC.1
MEINQAYPNEISWRLWQKVMKLWSKTRTLPKPMGRWMCDRYVQYDPDKENIHLFVNGKDSKLILTDTSAPAHIRMTDGMVTIEKVDCSGVLGDVQ